MHSIVPKIAGVGLCSVALFAYKDGPPANRTGGFGGETCAGCHLGNPLNDAGGSLRVEGVPERYRAGAVYRMTVTLRRAELYVGGFQMAARTKDGRAAGSWRALDDRTKVVEGAIEQTARGARAVVDGEIRWDVEWTAPATGEVVLNVAANASNDDASPLGDFIYTAEFTSRGP